MKVSEISAPEIIPTPFTAVNAMLGGGFATKKILEIAGPKSSGKTTLSMQFVGSAQKQGRKCYWADSERSYDPKYAELLGVDNEALEYDKQPFAEDLFDNLEAWAVKHKNGVIVIDAVGALLPREEAEKGASGRSIGIQARIVGSFCRRIVPILDDKNHLLIVINHTFIDPSTTALKSSGGMKLDYSKSVALWLRPAYGKAPKRSPDGQITVKFIEAEAKKDKVSGNEGRKEVLELVPHHGFVCETVELPPKKKPGRPTKLPVINN